MQRCEPLAFKIVGWVHQYLKNEIYKQCTFACFLYMYSGL